MANGVDDYADRDWTTYNQYAAEPNVRYVSMLTDRIFSAGDDTNPNSLYYTDAAPADGTNINQNTVVIGWDENGRINSISELGNIILAGKSNKVYTVDVTTPSALPIDAQSGMYCDRTIANVGNSLVYFSDRGVDTLKQRSGVSWSSALEGEPLGDDIRQLTSKTEPFQYNSGAARYIKPLNNYYYAFDTDDDNVPDTVLVYSSAVQSWTQYNLPNLYDFGEYIDSDQSINYLFTSANWGQAYQFETGFDDNGIAIDYELETKEFDMGTPGLNKTFDYVDVVGLKSEGAEIDVKLKVDSEEITESPITDANIDLSSVAKVLGETPLWTSTLTGASSDTDVDMYRFTFRCPCYATWDRISVNMSSTGGVWILEQMRISRDDEPIEVYAIDNIG